MRLWKFIRAWSVDVVSLTVAGIVFVIPFVFIFLTAAKDKLDASSLGFSLPVHFQLIDNLVTVIHFRNNLVITAMVNSMILTVGSVTLIVLLSALVGFVLSRRVDRTARVVGLLMLAGLILPPAIVPTIFLLQALHIFKTLFGLILVEVAFTMPFAILIFRAFMSSIPRDLDEAAIMDGASPLTLFFRVILPLLRPAVITVVVVASVGIYSDFVLPLYFLPGDANATAQLTLFNFQSQFDQQWNLLFSDVLLITLPPLILFIFFNRQLVSGMTAGAVKG